MSTSVVGGEWLGTEMSDEQIVCEAVRSVDLDVARSWPELEELVTRRALLLRRLLKPNSLPMRTLGAVPIPSKVLSIEEGRDRSERLLVTYVPLKGGDETKPEHVRTDRTDGPSGPLVRKLWGKELADPSGKGRSVVIYKTNEGGSGTGAGAHGYRNAPFVSPLGRG